MKIDTLKIVGYDEMSAEEKVKALESFEIEVESNKKYDDLKKRFDEVASEAADYKKKYKATLSEKEQLELEQAEKQAKMEAELQEFKYEKDLSANKANYIALGYDEELATETAKALLDGDLNKVFENQKKFNEIKTAELRKELLKSTPKPPAGKGEIKVGKERLAGMTLAEKQAYYESNPDEYKEIYK